MAAQPQDSGIAPGPDRAASRAPRPALIEARAVAEESVARLYRETPPAVIFSIAAASILAMTLAGTTDRARVAIWYGAILAVAALRLMLFRDFARRAPDGAAVLAWRRPYLWSLGLAASLWGFGGVWLAPAGSLAHQAVVYVFLVGMAGAALATYAAVRAAAMIAFVPVLLPMTIWLLSTGGNEQVGMGCGGLLMMAGSARALNLTSRWQRRNIALRLRLDQARRAAEQVTCIDPLTGVDDRRAFEARGAAAVDYCRRHGLPVVLLLIDIDRFRSINDRHGYTVGDEVLRRIGRRLARTLRGSDVLGRIGGDEFAVVLPHGAAADAVRVAEKLRAAVGALRFDDLAVQLRCTISVGAAAGAGPLAALITEADAALRRAQAAGGDRVALAADPP